MVRKHKEVFEKGASVDMSDLEKDPIVMFQKKWVYTIIKSVSHINYFDKIVTYQQ